MKKCKKCLLEKDESEDFFELRKDTLKFRNECKICRSNSELERYSLNRNTINKKRNSRSKNDSSRDADRIRSILYYKQNIEKVKSISKYFREHHPKYIISWRKNNIDKIRKSNNKRQCQRRMEDPTYKLRCNISSVISRVLKKSGTSKCNSSFLKYLEYSIKELKYHIESKFDDKMCWENYGIYWHLDHIIPQSKLLYSSMEDDNFKKCWALSNLQPLEKIENIRKSNK